MKSELKLSQKALERKSNKPIMEKKRRARINHCLNQLKALILETDSERSRHSKLEKADILEMTVRYLQTLRAYHLHLQQLQQIQHIQSHQQQQSPQAPLPTAQQTSPQNVTPTTPSTVLVAPTPHGHLYLNHHFHAATNQLQAAQISPTWRPW